jgi:uncharacterized membrane protein YphA (DoxX/SURF4 family)
MNAHTTSPLISATRPLSLPRPRTIVYWVATAPILLETAVGAEWDLARIPFVREVFAHLGYPLYLLTILGIAKVLAVFGLVAPRFRRVKEWAYAGVFFVYAGAAGSHYSVGDGPDKVGMPVLFAALTLISSALWASSQREGKVGR